ncbi:uncharacterized protein PHACADRAFT_198179 [Phanerochaete carnosa HHB-10118-sp]|uniref:Heterokaryon incompatibility domain-containing protein n=1 Tax=Phanerochaete carnosa (strain HHB-10118-sp) TaxID=650164 RepID=K5WTK0_PHACS|nr:uncharacterized protein PHACADRAFT_198179 [Phanerochaete carnosa HHB-10118-sp]EKM53757.1 hypothetical protein PHACADRAFT_198179 [Phanerochaete carnosa HHB-10118-sp]
MNITRLLKLLNDTLGTRYPLGKPELEQCLDHVLRTSQDFGQAYGILRRHWRSDFTRLLSDLAGDQKKDRLARQNALVDGYICNSEVPPRRVWDLYSNRVLPLYAINRGRDLHEIPDEVWTVSHSWVHESAHIDVSTSINGNQWPVPIPNDTTLDHVRVELLNLGAEYAWLDVLCLRQRGRPEDEEQRKEEWKLDVPTIGHVYSSSGRPCVTYFNGLGLPFNPSSQILSSTRHWLNRVWTVQEATDSWLPGGATGAACANTLHFFQHHLPRSILKKELDRVHSLAYILRCKTLPIYDEGISPELTWITLLKHMTTDSRAKVALRHAKCRPDDTSLFPSWADFMQCEQEDSDPASDDLYSSSGLYLLDDLPLRMPEPGTYFHKAVHSYGPVSIDCEHKENESGRETFKLQTAGASGNLSCYEIQDCKVSGTFLRSMKYVILELSLKTWLIVEVIGERQIKENTALEVVK